MADSLLHRRNCAEAMAEAMSAPPTTPTAWSGADDAWQAGYRQGLADARVIVAGVLVDPYDGLPPVTWPYPGGPC